MYKVFCVLLIILLLPNIEPEIPWASNFKLQWSNFKGDPNMKSEAAATTASGISFGYRVSETDGEVTKFTAQVIAHFYPNKSWYKPAEVTKHILEHEQLHFDITELYARKLRQKISVLNVSNSVNEKLDQLHQKILEELNAKQNEYDAACDYSRNKEIQQLWKQEISKQLAELNAFNQP